MAMSRLAPVCLFALTMVGLSACRHENQTAPLAVSEPYLTDPRSVGFDIAPLPNGSGAIQFLATYTSQGKTAKFKIELDAAPEKSSASPNGITASNGSIQAVSGSDASVLLVDLKQALEAKKFPAQVRGESTLPIRYAILGKNLTQEAGGRFTDRPAGHWTAMKIFIGSGEENDDGEAFLNFNAVTGKAQFSEADSDYGDYVLGKLATVL
jgi:hypothetical protein